MGKIISVCNQKGGVGKTTTTINLAGSVAHLTKSVLLIDLDPQSNATSGLGFDKESVEKGVYNIIIDDVPPEESIVRTSVEFLDILPSNINLIGAEVELVNLPDRETKLKKALQSIKDSYDYIFIDCPPSLGLLTVNALTASESVLIPIQCEYYAMEGLTQLMKTIHLIRQSLNPHLELEGVLLTMFDGRMNLSNQVVKEVRKFFGNEVYKSVIPRNVRLAEAPSYGKPVFQYDSSSRGTEAYLNLAKEFLGL
ncbi:MAG: AAA family ATPase [Elusimicrobia bacterium]|nr:AAA family ATPase [Elusimicrobiota bacterium]MBU2615373.1 AAA family ATPase [Elusimicrobiota bacterium]